MSLDGFIGQRVAARPTGGGERVKARRTNCPRLDVAEDTDRFFADWDDVMDANLAAVIATQDAVILGRRSYTEWAQFCHAARLSYSRRSSTGSRSMSRRRRPLTEIG